MISRYCLKATNDERGHFCYKPRGHDAITVNMVELARKERALEVVEIMLMRRYIAHTCNCHHIVGILDEDKVRQTTPGDLLRVAEILNRVWGKTIVS